MALNLYGYNVFDYNQALKDWELMFVSREGKNEDKGHYVAKVAIFADKRDYREITTKNGKTFTPSNNDFETFTVHVQDNPLLLKKGNRIKLEGVTNAYTFGDKFNPSLFIECKSIDLLETNQQKVKA
ncbi:hypothetical protein K0017_11705 [Staphylococcus massiliensis]|uniref:hypothetical protein n=1 Tax=Staphylococcus massiliensis TaxID=555791 RepID=UPI001EDD9453|nr:hypothetical protein [Staphylococcus massiliensis]MCG3402949.1 hypothetical protein [Staphylococcus massiliensis]